MTPAAVKRRLDKLTAKLDVLAPPPPPPQLSDVDFLRKIFQALTSVPQGQREPSPLQQMQSRWEALPEPHKSQQAELLLSLFYYRLKPGLTEDERRAKSEAAIAEWTLRHQPAPPPSAVAPDPPANASISDDEPEAIQDNAIPTQDSKATAPVPEPLPQIYRVPESPRSGRGMMFGVAERHWHRIHIY